MTEIEERLWQEASQLAQTCRSITPERNFTMRADLVLDGRYYPGVRISDRDGPISQLFFTSGGDLEQLDIWTQTEHPTKLSYTGGEVIISRSAKIGCELPAIDYIWDRRNSQNTYLNGISVRRVHDRHTFIPVTKNFRAALHRYQENPDQIQEIIDEVRNNGWKQVLSLINHPATIPVGLRFDQVADAIIRTSQLRRLQQLPTDNLLLEA